MQNTRVRGQVGGFFEQLDLMHFERECRLTETGVTVSSIVYKRVGNRDRHWRADRRRKHMALLRRKAAHSHGH